MLCRLLVFVICVCSAFLRPSFAGELQSPPKLSALVATGIDLTMRQEYDRADSVFNLATDRYPHHPLGYLYKAAVLEVKSMDFQDPLNFSKFDSLLDVAKAESQKIIETFPDSPFGYYYRGTAIGYEAYAQAEAGNWLAGFFKGLSAASDLKKAVELDSSFYDAYVGVGTYYYWKSRKAEFLNWALGDHRAEGIRLLEVAAEKANEDRYPALSALTAIYLDSGQFNLAIRSASRALERYPDNRIFLFGFGAALEQSGNYADAVQTYQRLLADIQNAHISNPYSEIQCRMSLINAKLALKDTEGLKSQIDAILTYDQYEFPQNLKDRAKSKFEQARNIRAHLLVQ